MDNAPNDTLRRTQRGEVSLNGRLYYSLELLNYHGEAVWVECTCDDRLVQVRDSRRDLICIAERVEITPFQETAHV